MEAMIFKILDKNEWAATQEMGEYSGSVDDLRDGFVHFSTASQLAETAAKHFAGRENLLLLGIETHVLGESLKWEASRGGQLFPHLYGSFAVEQVSIVADFPLDESGCHVIPHQIDRL